MNVIHYWNRDKLRNLVGVNPWLQITPLSRHNHVTSWPPNWRAIQILKRPLLLSLYFKDKFRLMISFWKIHSISKRSILRRYLHETSIKLPRYLLLPTLFAKLIINLRHCVAWCPIWFSHQFSWKSAVRYAEVQTKYWVGKRK